MTLKKTIEEYVDWMAEDCLKIFDWVKPTYARNIQEVKIGQEKFGWGFTLIEQDFPYVKFSNKSPKRLKWDSEDYYYVSRMDTWNPTKSCPVGWPTYENKAEQNTRGFWEHPPTDLSFADSLILSLLEIGIHESLEWITVCEMESIPSDFEGGYTEWEDMIPDSLPWPHDHGPDINVKAKINDTWFPLTVCF